MGTSPPMGPLLLLIVIAISIRQSDGLCDLLTTEPSFAGGTIRISIEEADTAFDTDITKYRGFLGLIDPQSSVVLTLTQKAGREPAKIDPSEFVVEHLTNAAVAGGGTRTGFFIRPLTPIDRDGATVSASDDTTILEYTLECTPTDTGSAQATNYIPLRINIVDINDNVPEFLPSSYAVNVSELTPVGTTVTQRINALDKDAGENEEIDYGIVPGDGTDFDGSTKFEFEISSLGNVRVKNVLDFEVLNAQSRTVYNMNISATDRGLPPRVTYTTLAVRIEDGDDLPPVFEYDSCIKDGGICFNPEYRADYTSLSTVSSLYCLVISSLFILQDVKCCK
ncbi:cadherin-99C-like [Patella vulgata]|uniref:cadherin-99C-like n=1 Tax=Patella vulgata TaxID=6465 RepID=UPI0024A90724|nr:cadherin-99C-like [Patella vulgata]